ncbi:MAG: xanthine dehydrogenase family protein molybdopterin-binding subunit, partial [Thermoflexus sp.]
MATRYVGVAMKRREDPRFITGRGTYVDDLTLPGLVYAAMVRSPHAHARIKAIHKEKALQHPGVIAVFTGKDMVDSGVKSLPCGWLLPGMKLPPHYPMAVDKVRHMGEIVAVVIAQDRYTAEDAAELVEVEYEPLPAVADGAKALQPGAPAVHDEAPDNVCFRWSIGDKEKTEEAFR